MHWWLTCVPRRACRNCVPRRCVCVLRAEHAELERFESDAAIDLSSKGAERAWRSFLLPSAAL
eukprot:9613672-Alexandrium_andersonii.AAC.1